MKRSGLDTFLDLATALVFIILIACIIAAAGLILWTYICP